MNLYKSLYLSQHKSDLIIRTKTKEFKCHSIILGSESDLFVNGDEVDLTVLQGKYEDIWKEYFIPYFYKREDLEMDSEHLYYIWQMSKVLKMKSLRKQFDEIIKDPNEDQLVGLINAEVDETEEFEIVSDQLLYGWYWKVVELIRERCRVGDDPSSEKNLLLRLKRIESVERISYLLQKDGKIVGENAYFEAWMRYNEDKVIQADIDHMNTLLTHVHVNSDNVHLYFSIYQGLSSNFASKEILKSKLKEFLESYFHQYYRIFRQDLHLLNVFETDEFWELLDKCSQIETIIVALYEFKKTHDLGLLKFDIDKCAEFHALISKHRGLIEPHFFKFIENGSIAAELLQEFIYQYQTKVSSLEKPKVSKLRMYFQQYENALKIGLGQTRLNDFRIVINNFAVQLARYDQGLAKLDPIREQISTCAIEWLLFDSKRDNFSAIVPFLNVHNNLVQKILRLPFNDATRELQFSAVHQLLRYNRTIPQIMQLMDLLSPESVNELCTSNVLAADENEIYFMVDETIKKRSNLTETQITQLYQAVRVEHLYKEHWNHFITNENIASHVRLDASILLSNISVGKEVERLNRRPKIVNVPYDPEFKKGILFKLGENLNTCEKFRNPTDRGFVSISMRYQNIPDLSLLPEHSRNFFFHGCFHDALEFTLQDQFEVYLTHYEMNGEFEARNWSLEVSDDKKDWKSVMDHKEESLKGSKVWEIPAYSNPIYAKYIRLVDVMSTTEPILDQELKFYESHECPCDYMIRQIEFYGQIFFKDNKVIRPFAIQK